jgi:hypothetical protein
MRTEIFGSFQRRTLPSTERLTRTTEFAFPSNQKTSTSHFRDVVNASQTKRQLMICGAHCKSHSSTSLSIYLVCAPSKSKAFPLFSTSSSSCFRGDQGSKAFQQLYFPKGKDDPNLSLLRVKSQMGEYWNYDTKEMMDFIFKAGKEAQKGNLEQKFHQQMPIGENSKVSVCPH